MNAGVAKATHFFGAAVATAEPTVLVDSGHSFSTPIVSATATGTRIITGLRVFKAGTFADSRGIVRTWTRDMLAQMVANFTLLRDNKSFPNVPIRVNHTGDMNAVVGYFSRVYIDPTDPDFLLADIEITEPDAYAKWQRGTFRSRSLEVGQYSTNDEQVHYPVVMGLAFVDIPAVEGLFSHDGSSPDMLHFSQSLRDTNIPIKENPVTLAEWIAAGRDPQEWAAACTYAAQQDAATAAAQAQQFEAACNYAAALEAHEANAQALGLVNASHGRYIEPAHTFSIGGQPVVDPAAVQAHITTLETFQSEQISTNRSNFVTSLAETGRIAATQIDSMQALVATMGHEQFEAFKASYEAAPGATLFQRQGEQGQGTPPGTGSTPTEVETLTEIVASHKRSGMSDEDLSKTASFKRLTELTTQAK